MTEVREKQVELKQEIMINYDLIMISGNKNLVLA